MARLKGTHPTIADVAAQAGVSSATVSRVLNRNASVDTVIADRVRTAIELLNYAPSSAARSLSLGRTNTVAVMVPDLENPMFHGVLKGVGEAAEADGYRVLVADTAEDPTVEAETARKARQHCDAIILTAPRMPEDELRELIVELAPVTVINRAVPGTAPVAIDYVAAVRGLVAELVTHGHRSIGYLAGPPMSVSNSARLSGIEESRRRYPGVRFIELPGGSRIDDGAAAADRLLESGVTAVIVFNDMAAFGVLGAMIARGISVPAQLSVAGIDDVPYAAVSFPPLTTMSIPRRQLGQYAWRQLKAALDGTSTGEPSIVAPTLVRRESTGPAPEAAPSTSRLLLADADAATGLAVAQYSDGSELPSALSRRPFLDPVNTLSGRSVTARMPEDHLHHLGVSLALPDVDGTSYWGGTTYVRDVGSTMLDNHGVQRRDGFDWAPGRIDERLTWLDEHGVPQLAENRTITARRCGGGWAMRWTSELRGTAEVSFGSPATNGRAGAGYGGIFWRFPFASARVFSEAGEGAAAVHGSTSSWIAVVDSSPDPVGSVLLVQSGAAPWFVRDDEYVGAGPSIAWDERRTLPAGDTLVLDLAGIVLDRTIEDVADARELLQALEQER